MVIWLLVFSILMLCIITHRIDRNYLSPSFVICIVFFVSSLLVAINLDIWNYDISVKTYLIIIFSLVSFIIGQTIVTHSNLNVKIKHKYNITNTIVKMPSDSSYTFLLIYGIITTALYFWQQYSSASTFRSITDLSEIVYLIRRNSSEIESNGIITLMFTVFGTLTYIYLFQFLFQRIIMYRKPSILKLIAIVALYFGCCIFSAARAFLFTSASVVIFISIYLLYYENNGSILVIDKKVKKYLLIIAVGTLILFRLLGYLTGKSEGISFFANIAMYAGSPIVCLDKYINGDGYRFITGEVPDLFRGLILLLNRFGAGFNVSQYNLPFQRWGISNQFGSNIYTALFNYYVAFGSYGIIVVQFLIGALYGIIWKSIKRGECSWSLILIYSMTFFYYLLMYSISEKLFREFISVTNIINIFIIMLVIRMHSVIVNKDQD